MEAEISGISAASITTASLITAATGSTIRLFDITASFIASFNKRLTVKYEIAKLIGTQMSEIINASRPKIFIICLFVVPIARSIPICFRLSLRLLLNEFTMATQEAKISTIRSKTARSPPDVKSSKLAELFDDT